MRYGQFTWHIDSSGLFRSLNETNQIDLSNQTNQKTVTFSRSDSDEVDEPPFNVRAHQLHSHAVSNVETIRACHQFPFDRRLQEPDPGTAV
jgi:hypothetical protein